MQTRALSLTKRRQGTRDDGGQWGTVGSPVIKIETPSFTLSAQEEVSQAGTQAGRAFVVLDTASCFELPGKGILIPITNAHSVP